MNDRGRFAHPVTVARRATRRRVDGNDEAGFTLIELIIVVVILPIVLGGIAAALLSVFGLQDQTQNRIGDSNDEQVSSSTFNKDVQSAQQIETSTTPACGTSGQTQLVGLEWGLDASGNYQTVVSYVLAPNGTTYWLVRQICSAPPSPPSSTPTSTRVDLARHRTSLHNHPLRRRYHDRGLQPLWLHRPDCDLEVDPGPLRGHAQHRRARQRLLPTHSAGSRARRTSTGHGVADPATQNPAGCNLASPGSGNYAKVLCFADFTSFTNANTNNTYCPNGTGQQMKLSIADSPDLLQFCVKRPAK